MVYRQPYYIMEGKGYIVKDEAITATGVIKFSRPKSYSVTAKNLETVEDVEEVIRQCESIKEQMSGGSDHKETNQSILIAGFADAESLCIK